MDTTLLIIIGTEVLLILAFAYVAVLLTSNKRILKLQNTKIAEIEAREQRYKALFENSVAGMMRFNFTTWEVLESNQALLDMFNCLTREQLQKTFTSFPHDQFSRISEALNSTGNVDGTELLYTVKDNIVRSFLLSARREGTTEIAHAVIIFMTAQKRIG